MNFDRNTVIGFVALALLFIGYFYFTTTEQQAYQLEKARLDSIELAKRPPVDTAALKAQTVRIDSLQTKSAAGGFAGGTGGTEQLTFVETKLVKVAFTNKGGQVRWVELKNFKGPDSTNVKLASTDFDKLNYTFNTSPGQTGEVTKFFFSGGQVVANKDSSQTITYQLQSTEGNTLTHQFVVRENEYMIDYNLGINGGNLFTGNMINFTWQNKALQLQKELPYEKGQSKITYRTDGDFGSSAAGSGDSETLDESINWVGVKQQFFNSTFIAKKNFTGGQVQWTSPETGNTVVEATANLKMQLPAGNANIPMAFYYGPTDYKILKQYGNDMEDMVDLGSGMFAFVKYINRWIILPAFDFFRKFTSNYGIVILLLTLFIRLLISPLNYKSYLSSAKMKALRPEIDKLKAKYGDDKQKISMEQMKISRDAGVNMFGGCLPALLQIPIFFALFSFFNSNIALRGQNFLWADDLSQYDSIMNLPFTIPFYGDHVSLFTITATLTSFLISIYSMSMTPDQDNPVMKYMPYFFPIILLFVFNSQPAALTWYYTVSNIITLILQFVIQTYIIDHDKILAKMEENRKKPKTKSKWQERMEQMQEQQKQLQQQRNKK
ncbi:MAG TPA: membrane protein insertase YidC [Chitinophagaceae bacterium]|nr:membrane protein insertase YidC [Chitinophagaceae bacterium]